MRYLLDEVPHCNISKYYGTIPKNILSVCLLDVLDFYRNISTEYEKEQVSDTGITRELWAISQGAAVCTYETCLLFYYYYAWVLSVTSFGRQLASNICLHICWSIIL